MSACVCLRVCVWERLCGRLNADFVSWYQMTHTFSRRGTQIWEWCSQFWIYLQSSNAVDNFRSLHIIFNNSSSNWIFKRVSSVDWLDFRLSSAFSIYWVVWLRSLSTASCNFEFESRQLPKSFCFCFSSVPCRSCVYPSKSTLWCERLLFRSRKEHRQSERVVEILQFD